jgi:hypothetical protein
VKRDLFRPGAGAAALRNWAATWTALALFSGSRLVTASRVERGAPVFDRALAIQFGSFLLWALLAAPLLAAARRQPFAPGRRLAALERARLGECLALAVTAAPETLAVEAPGGELPAALFSGESLSVARARLAELAGTAGEPPGALAVETAPGVRRLLLRLPLAPAVRAEASGAIRSQEVLWSRS